MLKVRDGNRVYQFEGELLAKSSSEQPDIHRWVEFELYRTKTGTYVLSRIGQTRLFHALDCAVVRRNNLKPSGAEMLGPDNIPCDDCDPDNYATEFAIEQPRHFALVSEEPEGVLDALYKYDGAGARYLTKVAERLLEDALDKDARLKEAYSTETIY